MITYNNIKYGFIWLLAGIITFSGCKDKDEKRKEEEERKLQEYLEENNINTEPTNSGLYYIEKQEGSGVYPEFGDLVTTNFTGIYIDGTIFDTNNDSIAKANGIYQQQYAAIHYSPVRLIIGHNIIGIDEGLQLMKPGGKAKLIIPSDLAYGEDSYGEIEPYTTLIYDMELVKIIKDPVEYEDSLINIYIQENSLSPDTTTNGVYYAEIVEGTGEKPQFGQYISISYTATLIDGRLYDKTEGDTVFSFTFGDTRMIEGLNEGISRMKEGGKATLIIPYDMGYGKYGNYPVPPYSSLVFKNLELVEIHEENK